MRQKVGKERSQGGGYPLGYPPPVLPAPENRDLRSQFIYLPTAFREISSSGAVPLGTRTGQPLPQAEDARCEASQLVQPKARPRSPYDGPDARRNFAKKSPAFACRAAPEPAVARRLARATQRVAIVLLTDQFPSACPEKPLRPTVFVRAPAKSSSNAFLAFERFRPLGAARGAARHANRASRLQPALSARWRILAKQLTLFRQYPTPVIARGPSYPDKLELRSGRAGPAYAAGARP